MPITIVKGRSTPHGFDPTLHPGWLTFLVNKETGAVYRVIKYNPKTKEMVLEGKAGNQFLSHVTEGGTDLKYDVKSIKDPDYHPPKAKVKKPTPYASIASKKET